jgi:enoyl-CoA hydratase/carnithine racemase
LPDVGVQREAVGCILITGSEKAFAAGAGMQAFTAKRKPVFQHR